jgi:4-azaleucine resistance transporter AzlC
MNGYLVGYNCRPMATLTAKQEFWTGIREELPILLGVAPFGMIYGVLAVGAGLTPPDAQAMSAVVFAGSAQFMLVQLIGQAAPAWVLIATVFVINLRHALYSASIAPYLSRLSRPWRAGLAYLLTDEAYSVCITHFRQNGSSPMRHFHLLGAGLALWTCWQVTTAVGIFLGAQVPASWQLDFTLALTFIALAVPGLRDRPTMLAALAAGLTAVLAYSLPYKLGLMLAALAGICVGLFSERFFNTTPAAPSAEAVEEAG